MPLLEIKPEAVAITYAQALYDTVSKRGQQAVEETLGELEMLLEEARANKRFGEFLSSRIVDSDRRAASLDRMFAGKIQQQTLNFLKVLNDKNRLSLLPGVVEAFDSIAQKAFGRVEVDVTTAAPIDPAQRDTLARQIGDKLGKTPVLHCRVDPAMLGGIRIQVGDRLIDASVATKLAKVREQLGSGGAATVRAAADKLFRCEPGQNGH
jgi:F-type H+-transporting ATPase subunit delta